MTKNKKVNHLAIIMDGNGRWAKKHNINIAKAYTKGAEVAKELIAEVIKHDIVYLTLYAFSSENWHRPQSEINIIMELLGYYLDKEIPTLHEQGVRVKFIGRLQQLSKTLQKKIEYATSLTKDNNAITVCFAVSYGSHFEIIDACNKAIALGKDITSTEDLQKYLYDPEMPNVDLLIRCGNVYRISNFLLWQSAYAELFFSSKYWPDFNVDDLNLAIEDYQRRNRTFGK